MLDISVGTFYAFALKSDGSILTWGKNRYDNFVLIIIFKDILMKLYNLDSKFNFGKYKDRILIEIATGNANYLEWCIMNVNFFLISESTSIVIKNIYPKFLSSEISKEVLNSKIEKWNNQQKIEADRENIGNSEDYDSNWNNEYYDEGLDLDQQSPEWYDSL